MSVPLERQGLHTDTTGVEGNCCVRESISKLTDEKDMASLCADKCKVSSRSKSFMLLLVWGFFFFLVKHILERFKYLNEIASPYLLSVNSN